MLVRSSTAHRRSDPGRKAARQSGPRLGGEAKPVGEPVRLRNENDSVAATLGGEIIAGAYPPGSLLPHESVLLERFKVSRPTLREAFRALAAKGLIISRQRVGTSVRPQSDWNRLDPDFLAWHLQAALTMDFVDDLFQLRQWVEPQAAAFAAEAGDPNALARIAEAYGEMVRFQDGSGDLFGADLRFHQAILDATGNQFIGTLGSLIRTALLGSFKISWRGAVIKDDRLRQHRDVLDAIEARQPDEARQRMATLLQDSIDDARRELSRIERVKGRGRAEG